MVDVHTSSLDATEEDVLGAVLTEMESKNHEGMMVGRLIDFPVLSGWLILASNPVIQHISFNCHRFYSSILILMFTLCMLMFCCSSHSWKKEIHSLGRRNQLNRFWLFLTCQLQTQLNFNRHCSVCLSLWCGGQCYWHSSTNHIHPQKGNSSQNYQCLILLVFVTQFSLTGFLLLLLQSLDFSHFLINTAFNFF